MSLLNALDAVFIRLSAIPGLGFLHEWVHELELRKQRRQAMISTYKGYVRSIKDAGKEAGSAMHGGRGGDEDHGRPDDSVGHDRRGGPIGGSQPGRDDFDDDFEQDYEDDDFESYLQ